MKIKQGDPLSTEMDMTPMIDMTFQLIAFLMVVINFEQSQADERVKLPEHALARPPKVAREHDLVLNVGFERNPDGGIVSGPWVFLNGENYPIDAMKANLQLEATVFGQKNVEAKEVTVVIRYDADVPTGQVQDLIKAAQEARFEKFALKAMQAEK